jgi:hypothetical protein
MSTKGSDVGTSQRGTRARKSRSKAEMKKLPDNIEIPEVPIPDRILIARRKHLLAIKRAVK